MRRALVLVASLALLGATAGHSSPTYSAPASQLTLWAWERPEDLRFLAGRPIRVAFLERTLILRSGRIDVRLRHQPLRVAPETRLVAVVRVETIGLAPAQDRAAEVASEIVQSAGLPRVDTLQIDFDARQSDRPFYAALLREVRTRLPPTTRLSMTALASWCADDAWIDTGAVDEIVPMLFQMGGDARHVVTQLREDGHWTVPACDGALGLATNEPWPGLPLTRAVYLFNPRPGVRRTFRCASASPSSDVHA